MRVVGAAAVVILAIAIDGGLLRDGRSGPLQDAMSHLSCQFRLALPLKQSHQANHRRDLLTAASLGSRDNRVGHLDHAQSFHVGNE